MTRGSQRVKAKEMAAKLEFLRPHISKVDFDLCQLIDKPKYIVVALLLGADPGPKSSGIFLLQQVCLKLIGSKARGCVRYYCPPSYPANKSDVCLQS